MPGPMVMRPLMRTDCTALSLSMPPRAATWLAMSSSTLGSADAAAGASGGLAGAAVWAASGLAVSRAAMTPARRLRCILLLLGKGLGPTPGAGRTDDATGDGGAAERFQRARRGAGGGFADGGGWRASCF